MHCNARLNSHRKICTNGRQMQVALSNARPDPHKAPLKESLVTASNARPKTNFNREPGVSPSSARLAYLAPRKACVGTVLPYKRTRSITLLKQI